MANVQAKATGRIRVQAIKLGFYGIERKRPKAVFYLASEKEFSKVWMRKLKEGETPPQVEPDEQAIAPVPFGTASDLVI